MSSNVGTGEWACFLPLIIAVLLFFMLPGRKRAEPGMQRTPQSDSYYGAVGLIIGALILLVMMLSGGGR